MGKPLVFSSVICFPSSVFLKFLKWRSYFRNLKY